MSRPTKPVQPPSTIRLTLKALARHPLLRSKTGASLAEFALVAGVIFTILIGTVELSYYVYVRNSVGAALSYAVKRSQTEPNAFVEFSEISDPNDPRYRNHLYARQVIAEEATAYLAKLGVAAKLHNFTHKDYFASPAGSNANGLNSGEVRAYQNQTLPIAFLGPAKAGFFTMPDGTKQWLSNDHVCDEMWEKTNPDLAVGQDSPGCKKGAVVRTANDSYKKFNAPYPSTFTASFTSNVLFGLNSTVTVAGFGAAGEGPAYAAAILNATATPDSTRPPHPTTVPTETPTELPTNTPPPPPATETPVPPATMTPTPSATPTSTATSTPISTDTAVPTSTPLPTETPTATDTATATATSTATIPVQPISCLDCEGKPIPPIDGECALTRADLQLLLAYLSQRGPGPVGPTPEEKVFDANNDGVVNSLDALWITNYLNNSSCVVTPTPTPTETPFSTQPPTKTPTPTETPTSTSTETPTATPTQTSTATSTPTVTATPESCPIFEVNVKYDGHNGRAETIFERNADTPACLENIFNQAEKACGHLKDPCAGAGGSCGLLMSKMFEFGAYDDCLIGAYILGNDLYFDSIYEAFFKATGGWTAVARAAMKKAGITQATLPLKPATVGAPYCEPIESGLPICVNREATFYLDKNCRSFDRVPDGLKTCPAGTFHWRASPISLEWNSGSSVDATLSVVDFELDPNDDKRFYIWKGSAETPLLVYDPKHTGAIRSAEQLFGEWTFGGRPLVKTSSTNAAARSGWSNGYEALASLDRNGDRKITAAELTDLALWFDKNRDGISQPGEVVPARRAGLTELRVDGLKKNSATGDLFVQNGFTRMLNGKSVEGRSVDWYGEGGNDRMELINKYVARGAFSPKENQSASTKAMPKSQISGSDTARDGASPLSSGAFAETANSSIGALQNQLGGVWNYKSTSDDSVGKATTGLLSFKVVSGDRFVGHSLLETFVRDNSRGLSSVIKVLPLEGRVVKAHGNAVEIAFSVVSEDGMRVESSATISGGKLSGKSTAHVKLGQQTTKIPYEWTALRHS